MEKRKAFSKRETLIVSIRDNGICALCGQPVAPEAVSIDHTIPLRRGGAHDPANWRLAHRGCNNAKQARTVRPTIDIPAGGMELKQWREARKLSINKLARMLGVEPSTVLRWERDGVKMPGVLVGRAIRDLERELNEQR